MNESLLYTDEFGNLIITPAALRIMGLFNYVDSLGKVLDTYLRSAA